MTERTDPVVRLRARVHGALAELRELRCTDPAATAAIHAVRLTERTLEHWWLATLDRSA